MAAIKRNYGKDRTLGDIIYNPNTGSVFCKIELGFFSKTINLKKREDGCYDILVSKFNSEETVKIGQTFPVRKQDNSVVEGLSQSTLGLFSAYDSVKQKTLSKTEDALFITTHKLKEPKAIGDKGFLKVGWITGNFGIEIADASSNSSDAHEYQEPDNTPVYDDEGDRIPF